MFWTNHMMGALRWSANIEKLYGYQNVEHLAWNRGRVMAAAFIEARPRNDADELASMAAINEARFLTTTYQRS